jgi:hypothetical protein
MKNAIVALFAWFGSALSESNGQPSSMRLVVTLGSLAIVFGLVGVWVIVSVRAGTMSEVPASVGTTLGSYLLTLLGAKVLQKGKEDSIP